MIGQASGLTPGCCGPSTSMCVLENMSTPNGIFPQHRDARVTALVNVLFHVNKILNAKDCEGHSVCTGPCNEPRRCPGSSLDTTDKSQSSRHIPCAVHLESSQKLDCERHGGACLLLLSAVSRYHAWNMVHIGWHAQRHPAKGQVSLPKSVTAQAVR